MKRTALTTVAASLAVSLGCGAPEAPSTSLPAGHDALTSAPIESATPANLPPVDAGSMAAGPAGTDAAVASKPTAQRFVGTSFPPADFDPPHERSAKPGDGKWTRLGHAAAGDRLADGRPVMFKTVVHPHPVSRFMMVTVVAMDVRHTELFFVPGTGDPGVDTLPASQPAGLVPAEHHDALLVVFNGGFLPRHGRWGMMVAGKTLVPAREGACAVGIYRDGSIRIRSWSGLAATEGDMKVWRQTPPCVLEEGQLHRELQAGNERPWGGRDPSRKTRRRTALGIDASGRVLLFGMGSEVGPRELADGMRAAGAEHAAQLDINWSWTRFLLFGRPSADAKLQVTSTLVPKMVHSRVGYVSRSAARDFFYVIRR